MISVSDLNNLLKYDPESGIFLWLRDTGRAKKDTIAGTIRKDGYCHIMIKRKSYLSHRLAWFLITGQMPNDQIDHINRIKHDNRFCNLRLATNKQNGENVPKSSTNTSGFRGVGWDKARNKWKVQIKHFQKNLFIGRFDSLIAANEAAKTARDQLFTHSID